MHIRRTAIAALSTIAGLVIAVGCTDASERTATPVLPAPTTPHRIVLDYSPTVSDAGALLYLAAHPDVDLLAVTLPGTGEADCESGVRATHGLLAAAGRSGVPVACGRDAPLEGNRDWPAEWRNSHEVWLDLLPAVTGPSGDPRGAEQLLVDTLTGATSPVTVVTVGPLTNVGAVLSAHPELVAKVASVVVMGGAVHVPGNVDVAPTAEWNVYVDPEALRRVIESGAPVLLVPLDATNAVPWSLRLAARLELLDATAADTMSGIVDRQPGFDGLYLWDELTAVVAVDRAVVTIEERAIEVDDTGATLEAPRGRGVHVAVAADATAMLDEWLGVLAGGEAPTPDPLTDEEMAYLIEMGGIDSRLRSALNVAFPGAPPEEGDPRAQARTIVTQIAAAITDAVEEMAGADPPASMAALHDAYVAAMRDADLAVDVLLAAVDDSTGSTVDEVMEDATTRSGVFEAFDAANQACAELALPALARGGPRPCSLDE